MTAHDPVSEHANVEAVLAAHDALHKGDATTAHDCLHRALGLSDGSLPIAPLAHVRQFEQAFATACRKNGIRAAYILIDPVLCINRHQPKLAGSAGDSHLTEIRTFHAPRGGSDAP